MENGGEGRNVLGDTRKRYQIAEFVTVPSEKKKLRKLCKARRIIA